MADNLNKVINVTANTSGANAALQSTEDILESMVQTEIELGRAASASADRVSESASRSASAVNTSTAAHEGNRQAVLENGGAVAILDSATGGLATRVRDAFEASRLFTGSMKAQNIVQSIYTALTGKATVATNGFKIALAATGIGAILLLIGGLALAYNKLVVDVEEAKKSQEDYNYQMSQYREEIRKTIALINERSTIELEKARGRGASIREVRAIEKKASEDRIAEIRGEISILQNAPLPKFANQEENDKFFKDYTDRLKELNKEIEEIELNQRIRSAKNAADDLVKTRDDAQKANDKRIADEKAANDKRLKDLEAYNKARIALEKKVIEDIEDATDESELEQLYRQEEREKRNANEVLKKEDREKQLLLIEEKYGILRVQLRKKLTDEADAKQLESDKEIAKKRLEEIDAVIEDYKKEKSKGDPVQDALLSIAELIGGGGNFEAERKALDEKQALLEEYRKNDLISDDEYTAAMEQNNISRNQLDAAQADSKKITLDKINGYLKAAVSILGENTKAGKHLAAASAVIDTLQSSISAYKGMVAAIPGPVGIAAGAVAAGASLATGYATVKKIYAVKVPGAGGGDAGGAGAAPSGAASTPSFNLVGANTQSQLSETIANQQSDPVRAYVVSNDVSNQQALDRSIISNATFG